MMKKTSRGLYPAPEYALALRQSLALQRNGKFEPLADDEKRVCAS